MLLHDAVAHALTRWGGMRRQALYECWARELQARLPSAATMDDLTLGEALSWVARMQTEGLAPATIYAKVSFLSVLYDTAKTHGWQGTKPALPYPHVPRVLKWWPNPDEQARILAWCLEHSESDLHDYLVWTFETGLRVEETLAVRVEMFTGLDVPNGCELLVPGTKTSDAQATLPISEAARVLAGRRIETLSFLREPHLFPVSYSHLARTWRRYRKHRGLPENATLKAMRRAFARSRAGRGTPLPILQQMMRHRDPHTTMEYLRLTGGGFTSEEMRKYL